MLTVAVRASLLVIATVVIVLAGCKSVRPIAPRESSDVEDDAVPPEATYTSQLAYFLREYRRIFGQFPPPELRAEFALESARNAGLEFHWRRISSTGEFLDIYGRAYRITYIGTNTVQVRSAGPDGVFGNSDDFFSETFVKESTPTQRPHSTATPSALKDR